MDCGGMGAPPRHAAERPHCRGSARHANARAAVAPTTLGMIALVRPRATGSIAEFGPRTTDLLITATTAAAADEIVAIPVATFDGIVPMEIQFQAPSVSIEDGTGAIVLRRTDTQAILSTIARIDGFTQPVGFP